MLVLLQGDLKKKNKDSNFVAETPHQQKQQKPVTRLESPNATSTQTCYYWNLQFTPLKINMEHNSLDVWFRSCSFLFMGDDCRFQPLIFGSPAQQAWVE